jgi:hypothetical protein
MPTGQPGNWGDGKKERELPAPESPVWLPSLALTRGTPGFHTTVGHSVTGYTLPKQKNLPVAATIRGNDPTGLFSMATLPTAESLELPGGVRRQKVSS